MWAKESESASPRAWELVWVTQRATGSAVDCCRPREPGKRRWREEHGWRGARLFGARLRPMAREKVFRHGIHRRSLLVFDLFLFDPIALIFIVNELHRLVDLFEQVNTVTITEMFEADLDDGERHLGEVEEGLVAMHSHA